MVRNAKGAKSNRKGGAVAEAEPLSDGPLAEPEESPYRHYVEGERLTSDGAFFELFLIKVLQEGNPVADFEEIWPRATQALAGLNAYRLSQYSAAELESIIDSVGGDFTPRMTKRAADIVAWADAFWHIRQIYGSFRQYVRSFDMDGPDALVEDILQRLPNLSPAIILAVLRTSGEKIPNLAQYERPSSGGGRQSKSRRSGGQSRGGRRRGRGSGRKGKGGNEKSSPAKTNSQSQAKSGGDQNKDKGSAKKRKGRRTFFRRKRAARGNSAKKSTGTNGSKS
jgi:hypothetical protein